MFKRFQLTLKISEIKVGHAEDTDMPIKFLGVEFFRDLALRGVKKMWVRGSMNEFHEVVKKMLFHALMNVVHGVILLIYACETATMADNPVHVIREISTIKRLLSRGKTQDLFVLPRAQWPLHHAAILEHSECVISGCFAPYTTEFLIEDLRKSTWGMLQCL